MMLHPGADPHAPMLLFALPAARPAQPVPWPASVEFESSSGLGSLSPASYPLMMFRSGWLMFTPVSRMAMIVLATPNPLGPLQPISVSYTHLRAHETPEHLVCRL